MKKRATKKKKGERRTVKGNLQQYANRRPRVYTGGHRRRRDAADLTATPPMTVTERATDTTAHHRSKGKGGERPLRTTHTSHVTTF